MNAYRQKFQLLIFLKNLLKFLIILIMLLFHLMKHEKLNLSLSQFLIILANLILLIILWWIVCYHLILKWNYKIIQFYIYNENLMVDNMPYWEDIHNVVNTLRRKCNNDNTFNSYLIDDLYWMYYHEYFFFWPFLKIDHLLNMNF